MTGTTGARLKPLLRGGEGFGVIWLSLGSLPLVEMAAAAGPPAIVLDLQHGLWDRPTLEAAIAAAGPCPVIARVAENGAVAISQALDAGAEGVLVPLVESGPEAAMAVAHAHFPPLGRRSGGGVRPLSRDFGAYLGGGRDRTTVGVMIETAAGVARRAEIAGTPGLDFLLIGTGDLSISLGAAGPADPRVEAACAEVLAACQAAGLPCGIFTGSAEAARRRLSQGYAMAVVADDITLAAAGFRQAVAQGRGAQRPPALPAAAAAMPGPLGQLAGALASGAVRVVDLSQPLGPDTPVIALPPGFGQSAPFRSTPISAYDAAGPAWAWSNISLGEHTGTHFDAPVHWVSGKDLPNNALDTIGPERLVAPACVLDFAAACDADEDFLLEPRHILAWEAKHGRIERGSWVLLRSGWSRRADPAAFLNVREDGAHSPGPSPAAVRLLVEERDVIGFGTECVGTDAGQAFAFDPPFPCHALMHGAGKFGLASLANLHLLPPKGAILVTPPLKIVGGTGSPCRVLALAPG